jgi:hypothetical protein
MARKPATRVEFTLFDVVYEDGSRRSNRRVRELFTHRVSLRTEFAPALPMVLADRVQLQQVIINLVMNSVEAMQPITTRPRQVVIRSNQNEGREVLVTVEDCGIGISAENADRLFNPFFTTKSSGMGMGLSICRSIIGSHGDGCRPPIMSGRARRFSSLCRCIKRVRRHLTFKIATRPRKRRRTALPKRSAAICIVALAFASSHRERGGDCSDREQSRSV